MFCIRSSWLVLGSLSWFSLVAIAVAEPPRLGETLTEAQASQLAKLAVDGLNREYPNKPSNVLTSPSSLISPKEMHPAFYGCFDWHSSVHGHWMLVRLLKLHPQHPLAKESRRLLAEHLTAENLKKEAIYFDEKENRSFERMYGWAWLLRLVEELHDWEDLEGKVWRSNLEPLEKKIVELTENYLPKLTNPIRTGVHPDTPFALAQILDYARGVKNQTLEELVVVHGKRYFYNDQGYNENFEPSGEDFFSTSLNEADLMRRILAPAEYSAWLDRFLPSLKNGISKLLKPVEVSDVTDGKLVHLAGLDLSRAWTLNGVLSGLPKEDPKRNLLRSAAIKHADVGLGYVFSGQYEGEHWLGTFAVYALTEVAIAGKSGEVDKKPSSAAANAIAAYEEKPADPRFEKFNPRLAPRPGGLMLRKGDRLAIVGDSITEQKMYSRMIETYLTVCVPELEITTRQYGWSGEKADGFLRRMEQDCLRFHPTVATISYGMNDSRYRPFDDINGDLYRDLYTQIVRKFKMAGVRPIVGSPGCAGKIANWVKTRAGTLDEHNLHLCALRDLAIELAHEENVPFADIFWPMYQAQILAPEKYKNEGERPYEVAGKDGIHPSWAGQVMMAYAYLRAMGLDGEIGTFEFDASNSQASVSKGHELVSCTNGLMTLKSHRYPFCATGPLDRDDSIRSGMTLVPFNAELNRLTLKIKNGNARNYRVIWGGRSREYSIESLTKGINLADEFVENPFLHAFENVDVNVLSKQSFETKQVKQIFHGKEGKENFEKAVEQTEKERETLLNAIRLSFVPVTHQIKIEAIVDR